LEIGNLIAKDIAELFNGETKALVQGYRHFSFLIDEFLKSDT